VSKVIYITLLSICLVLPSYAQVYKLSKHTDYSIAFGVTTLFAMDYVLLKSNQPLSATEAFQLDPQSVSGFERNTIFKRSIFAGNWSDNIHFATFALPLSVLLTRKGHGDVSTIGVMFVEAVSLNLSATFLTKFLFKRPRPFIYNPNTVLADKQTRSATESFVSGHTSNSALLGVFSATVFSKLFPNSKWKKPMWIAGLVLPATVGILRVESGKHFPTDVIAGYGLGTLIGYLIPEQHRVDQRIKLSVVAPGSIGVVINLN